MKGSLRVANLIVSAIAIVGTLAFAWTMRASATQIWESIRTAPFSHDAGCDRNLLTRALLAATEGQRLGLPDHSIFAFIYQSILISVASIRIRQQIGGNGDWCTTERRYTQKVAASFAGGK